MKPSITSVRRAVTAVRRGEIIAYPTEAVYGLGCDPANGETVRRLLALKHRPMHKGLIVVASSLYDLRHWLAPLTAEQRARIDETWPGPVTWLLPVRANTPRWLRGQHRSLAVRISAHPVVRALCREFNGPLVSTSANPAGHAPARSATQVKRYFGHRIALIVDGDLGGATKPSEIRDARNGDVVRGG